MSTFQINNRITVLLAKLPGLPLPSLPLPVLPLPTLPTPPKNGCRVYRCRIFWLPSFPLPSLPCPIFRCPVYHLPISHVFIFLLSLSPALQDGCFVCIVLFYSQFVGFYALKYTLCSTILSLCCRTVSSGMLNLTTPYTMHYLGGKYYMDFVGITSLPSSLKIY